jgi:hypothetical protein
MFMSNATTLAANPVFRLKLILILVAIINVAIFHWWTGKSIEHWRDEIPLTAKISAGLSLVIWVAVISCGRLLAFS